MDKWTNKMQAAIATARLLENFNVIDVSFDNGEVLEVYVAMSKEEKAIGLATIPYLDVDGMMFFYDKPSFTPFTVADMGFDLDIAWFDSSGSLIKSGTYKAGSNAPLFSPKPYTYVVETLAGNLPKSNLKVFNV